MHPKYHTTVAALTAWCQQEQGVQGAVVLGSQVREELTGDEWSDLDVLLLVDDPQALLHSNAWLAFLGQVVCTTVEETPLPWVSLTWSAKRILFADHRAVDFSIMPADRLDDVLAMNAEIHANGYQVIYDAHSDVLAAKVEATLAAVKVEPPKIPTEDALRRTVDDLLFQLMWASKKIRRNELWVAVQGINQPINNRLLQLIEFYGAVVAPHSTLLSYEGRFLEQRIPPELRERLARCFARYDTADAIQTVHYLLDLTAWLAQAICAAFHYPFNAAQFGTIRTLYEEMFPHAQEVT